MVSWGRGGIVAFGTCNSVALYDPQVTGAVIRVGSSAVYSLLVADANTVCAEKLNIKCF